MAKVYHPIRRYRERNNLTQAQLAEKLGVTPVTVCRWENDRRAPRRRDILKIAEVTGLSVAEVIGLPSDQRAAE